MRTAKKRVLFVCIHNSARSQMAEAFLNQICGEEFAAESADIEPGQLNPIVVEAMREVDLDISNNKTKSVTDFVKSGALFAYVITVCDETNAERCTVFAGVGARLHWASPTHPVFKARGRKSWPGPAKSGTLSRPGSRNGAPKCVPPPPRKAALQRLNLNLVLNHNLSPASE